MSNILTCIMLMLFSSLAVPQASETKTLNQHSFLLPPCRQAISPTRQCSVTKDKADSAEREKKKEEVSVCFVVEVRSSDCGVP